MKFNFTLRFSKWAVVSTLALAAIAGCQKYDDSELRNLINDLQKNNSELQKSNEDLQQQLSDIKNAENNVNNDIKALNQLVSTLETGNYIKSVTTLNDGSGYIITFAEGDPILVKNGTDGEKGAPGTDGEDGTTPVISVKQSGGIYYWTLNGVWLLDDDGNKLRVTGEKGDTGAQGIQGEKGEKGEPGDSGAVVEAIAPQVRINTDTNEWEISTDSGKTWKSTGVKATGEKGEKGEKGDTGAQGVQGEKGDKGDQGIQGEKGDQGEQGMQGEKGEKGDKGDQGEQGIQGDKGDTGATGATGAAGKDGVTPLFKIVDGNWMVSYDGGASWSDAGSATSGLVITDAAVDESTKTLILTLADGTKIPITYNSGSTETSYIVLDKTSETIGSKGGTITIKVNASGAFTATCPESWVTIASDTDICTITVAANSATTERTATVTITCGDSTKTFTVTQSGKSASECAAEQMETVLVKAGTFMMGSPTTETDRGSDETQHQVTLTQDFYMGKYQVTNAQFCVFLNEKAIGSDGTYATSDYGTQTIVESYQCGVTYSDDKWIPQTGYENYPVVCVTWYGADEYAEWIGGALPTEAQWEYACRAGSTTAYCFGDSDESLGDYAWYSDNSDGKTHPVGLMKPNAWGLYDMHGNVCEWCADWYGSYGTTVVTDPTGPATGSYRILRGGSESTFASSCRSARRYLIKPVNNYKNYGFRVCFPSSSSIE